MLWTKVKVYANEPCWVTFHWLCWLYLLACCIGPILELGSIPPVLCMLTILACCRAYSGNKLQTTSAWSVYNRSLTGSRLSVPCWDIFQISIAGLLTSVPCWVSFAMRGEQLTVSIQAFCIIMKMLNFKVP